MCHDIPCNAGGRHVDSCLIRGPSPSLPVRPCHAPVLLLRPSASALVLQCCTE